MLPFPPADELRRRIPRLMVGLVMFGLGVALMVRSDLGLSPWDVLHQGVAKRTGLGIGTVTILTGFVVLFFWLPLRERLGIGTVLNVIVIGVVANVALGVLEQPDQLWLRVAFLAVGIFVFGPGSGFYIGAGLGAGPRDGLMTGIARRGRPVRVVRTVLELTALAGGAALGGTVGIGTVAFALTIGPNVHFFLERMTMAEPRLRARRTLGDDLPPAALEAL
ncbi:MAG: membrane protein YczE [Microthrixaceae bacterium]